MKTIKNLIGLIMMTTAINSATYAQPAKKFKELKITKTSQVINVSADELWQIVGPGYAKVHEWSTAVDHAVPSGEAFHEETTCSERSCTVSAKGFDKLQEVIKLYEPENRTLSFDIEDGLPSFIQWSNSKWQVVEVGPNQSKVQITGISHMNKFMGTLMAGMFKNNVNKALTSIFYDLKIYAETGEISDQKKKRNEKLLAKK